MVCAQEYIIMFQKIPDTIYWPGRGEATRLMPRGMSDYSRLDNHLIYVTQCGAKLFIVKDNKHGIRFKCQYKGHTTKFYYDALEAMESLNNFTTRINVFQN